MVPDKVLADYWSLEQRNILTQALLRDRQYCAQSLPIAFDLSNATLDAPGTAGSGTTGGVPAESDGQGGYRYVQATAGSAVEIQTSGVVTLVDDTAVVSATANTLTGLGVTWTTNAYTNDTAIIVAGLGANQPPRTIASNTATQLTVTDDWAIAPDDTSVFQIVQSVDVLDQTFGAVTDLPSTTTVRGYLVKLDAQGNPYLDTTTPLSVNIDRGVPLPPFQSVLGGTVRLRADAGQSAGQWPTTAPLTLGAFADRFRPRGDYNAYVMNGTLMLVGGREDWSCVQGIELSYVPIPPALTARTDYFLLPDTALPLLVARGALFAASRLQGLPDVPSVPMDAFLATEQTATRDFFGTLHLTRSARVSRMRRGRY
jgi:hypothetical protein